LNDVIAHFADQGDVGIQVVTDKLVHRLEVVIDDGIDSLEIHVFRSRQRVARQRAMLAVAGG
jgi:hypothetical protein